MDKDINKEFVKWKIKKPYYFFHQGWTDIAICLPLIDTAIHLNKKNISVLMREDSQPLVKFYCRGKDVNIINLPFESVSGMGRKNDFSLIMVLKPMMIRRS